MRLYGLLDCNNFFVSCERLFRPDLKNYPTVVLGSNDGVVISRSEEAKKLGVPMGVPYFKVRDLFKEHKVAQFSSNFELYQDISKRVMLLMAEELENVYQYSIDEAFFEIDVKNTQEAENILRKLKSKIETGAGIPVSLGAGVTMTIAKYASELEKRKSGVCVLFGDSWKALVKEIPIGEIWGVGGKTAVKMRDIGVLTVNDLLHLPEASIKANFGVHGLRLWSELSEKPAHDPSERNHFQKSIMSTRSFSKVTSSLSELESAITYHTERVAKELRDMKGKANVLGVVLGTSRHNDWFMQGGRNETHLAVPTADTRVLLKEALRLTRSIHRAEVPYKKAGVIINNIVSDDFNFPTLWPEETNSNDRLISAVDSVNEKFGKEAVTFGRVKTSGKLDHDQYRSLRYTTTWNELRKISKA